ncbi:T-cell antigen CD7-like isoform X2 [Pygocentrus nattereri]|uniref:T-cell antigen CD7-like isoform X2 n=1 Tax=Pygocentrus nattereri TaxID=42514 RepID=UPI00081427D2|nr:T-cell antigen CD7-like isoform X2 [Pygocentrus nattereri]
MKTLSVTLCFTAVLFSQYSVALTAGSVMKNQGETLTMVCTTEDTDPIGLYLRLRCPEKHEVFYYDIGSKTLTIPPEFEERITVSGDPKKLTVTITSLRVNESGVYSCVFNFFDVKRVEKETNGALLFVKGVKEPSAMPEMLVLVSVLLVCTVFILCVLVTVVWIIPKVKAL